jgi:hypothetical protein
VKYPKHIAWRSDSTAVFAVTSDGGRDCVERVEVPSLAIKPVTCVPDCSDADFAVDPSARFGVLAVRCGVPGKGKMVHELRWIDLATGELLATHVVDRDTTMIGPLSTSGKTLLMTAGSPEKGFVVADLARGRDVLVAQPAPFVPTAWVLAGDTFVAVRDLGKRGDAKQPFEIVAMDAKRLLE